jgi:hypothetical protein
MATIKYQIVQHDEGWAYRVGDTFSETYRSHDEALAAANRAAAEQQAPDRDADIEWEDEKGQWHTEHASGKDRPGTEVEDQERRPAQDRGKGFSSTNNPAT